MQLTMASVSLGGGLSGKLEAIAAAGFAGVEIFDRDLEAFPGTPADVAAIARKLGLNIVTYQPFRDVEGMPAGARERIFAEAKRLFDVMGGLGCDLLMVCSNTSPDAAAGLDRAAADLRELGERAATHGIRIGFEALAWGRHITDYRDAWEVVRRADHPNVGLILDAFHILARKSDLRALRTIPGERIFLVQISDAPMLDMDYLPWSRGYRCLPGKGTFPLADYLDAVGATGYAGPLSLEIFNTEAQGESARAFAAEAHRALAGMLDGRRGR